MKTSAGPLFALAALLSMTIAVPTPSEGASFLITDLIGSDLTIDEYAARLEGKTVDERSLSKRRYTSDTYNQLTDGTACRPITVIYARGTTQAGNVGAPDVEGPTFFNALASAVGGESRLAIQGVTYSASVVGFLAGGDAAGATTMYNLINTAVTKCPSTKIVVSGYSQGAQLVHTATQRLSAAAANRVTAIVTFGDADRDETFGLVPASKADIICHDGDDICDNGINITPEHRNYEKDAPKAAAFVAARV